MTARQDTGCAGCRSANGAAKLGMCKECILTNAMASVFCWAVFCFLLFVYPAANVLYTSLGFACLFTLLLLSHGIAAAIRYTKEI
jgi:hypothetical protein